MLTVVGVSLDAVIGLLLGFVWLLADGRRIEPVAGPEAATPALLPALAIEERAALGRIWVESGADSDYVLDRFALEYLPAQSAARRVGQSVYWCGTPMLALATSAGRDATIPEVYLLLRAIRLQREYAPEEAERGPIVGTSGCTTPNCTGRRSLVSMLEAAPGAW